MTCDRKSQVTQHLENSKYITNSKFKSSKARLGNNLYENRLIKLEPKNQNLNEFNKDLCSFMMANDIPLWKL